MANTDSPVTGRRHAASRGFAASLALGAAAALILAGLAAPAAGAVAAPAGPAGAGSSWAIQRTPNPLIGDSGLTSVSCTSASACIAVGGRIDRAGPQVTLAERWNGTRWSMLKTPNPPGNRGSRLVGVSCTSPAFCIAVGNGVTATDNPPLAEVWNGSTWSIQTMPDVPGAQLSGVSCTSPTACTLVGSSGSALAERWNGTSWSVQQVPTPPNGTSVELAGVSCTSASACTAVGSYRNGDLLTLAEAWNGSTWSRQATPSPRFGGTFNGVSCTSASACTAVGNNGNDDSLAERWNGSTWSIQATPDVRGDLPTILDSVSCSSATRCTATGHYYPSAVTAPVAEQWNGTAWSVQQVPNPQPQFEAALPGVSCSPAGTCIAAGYDAVALAEAWNGTSWSVQRISTPPGATSSDLTGVSCTSASACMAVGTYRPDVIGGDEATLAEAWNGTSWSIQPTPASPNAFGDGFLTGVSCTSATFCVAVGYYFSRAGVSTLAEVWNGTSWSLQPTPDQPGADESFLLGVSCSSNTACTAVGYYETSTTRFTQFTLAEAWNGTSWSIQPTPKQQTAVSKVLRAVSCVSAHACTAVGNVGYETLAEAWNGTSWSKQPTPHPEHGPDTLLGVTCRLASACIAVGSTYDGRLAETWNGTSWSIQPVPGPETTVSSQFAGVSCPTASACTAVWATNWRTVAANWNGTSWTPQRTASPPHSLWHLLRSVSCVPAGGCTAVGTNQSQTGRFTLAEVRP
jgi:hypothetical protein